MGFAGGNVRRWIAFFGLGVMGPLAASEDDGASSHCSKYRGPEARPARLTASYTSPEGIGYHSGYGSLAFFAGLPCEEHRHTAPFLDVRGHLFDDGKWAANGGIGLRFKKKRIYGINAYYDYRETYHQNYQQIGAGLENLGSLWDFRINGYLPVGPTKSHYFRSRFSHFDGHSLLIRKSRDYAMKGGNAEVGLHLDCSKNLAFYLTTGPYYLNGGKRSAWGGEARLAIDLFNRYLRLEGNGSYDSIFNWVGQGRLSLNIPFGKRYHSRRPQKEGAPCFGVLSIRSLQPVERYEIIAVEREHSHSVAINPLTAEPWVFWFVDNTSHSAGTYEDPYPTLTAAQVSALPNQAIYVFPGDGTSTGMDAGIILQDGQQFLGASVPHSISTTEGAVTIPAMATSLPKITNASSDVVTAGNSNTVSGFYMTAASNASGCIFGSGVANLTASDNYFTSTPTVYANGIYWFDAGGFVESKNNTFDGFISSNTLHGNGIFIDLDTGYTLDRVRVTNNVFTNLIGSQSAVFGGAGIFVYGSGTLTNLDVSTSVFENSSNTADGIYNVGTIGTLNFSQNLVSQLTTGNGISSTGTIGKLNVLSSQFLNNDNASGILCIGNNPFINILGTSFSNYAIGAYISGIVDVCEISRCSFECPQDITCQLTQSQNTFLKIDENQFLPLSGASAGYATSVTVNNASANLCLDFQNNTASKGTPTAYQFTQQQGIFNVTPGSGSATNQGGFVFSGAIGSCTDQ